MHAGRRAAAPERLRVPELVCMRPLLPQCHSRQSLQVRPHLHRLPPRDFRRMCRGCLRRRGRGRRRAAVGCPGAVQDRAHNLGRDGGAVGGGWLSAHGACHGGVHARAGAGTHCDGELRVQGREELDAEGGLCGCLRVGGNVGKQIVHPGVRPSSH